MRLNEMEELIEISLMSDTGKCYEVNLDPIIIEGEKWRPYEANISYRDILLICDKGTVIYLVDSYGSKHSAVLHDWRKDNELPQEWICQNCAQENDEEDSECINCQASDPFSNSEIFN